MRLPDVQKETGINFHWRPFSVRKIMMEMDNIPFSSKPVKEAYMWRDIERRAERYGLPVRVPAPYPLNEYELVNKIAVLARKEGWCEEYVRSSYRYWFQDGLEAGSDLHLSKVFDEIGQDKERVLREALGDHLRSAYFSATDEARAKNVFGAPTFTIGNEVFWGDDRLDDAIAFYRRSQ